MKTTPYFEAGHLAASSIENRGATEASRIVDRQLLRVWQYRRMLRSPLIQPFSKVLRPLIRRLFLSDPDGVNFKLITIGITLLMLLIVPLIFAMLLPLILILLPLAILAGLIGLAATSSQTDEEDSQHHSLVWHMVH